MPGCFVFAGGGTGGHVVPSLAVAAELRARGLQTLFIGTQKGMESKLVPKAGFTIEWIEIGGLNRVGWKKALHSLWLLPKSILRCSSLLAKHNAQAVFSMGGYVAAPVVIAALLRGIPVVAMEPNAMPGMVTRKLARWMTRALVAFESTRGYFPAGRAERCGLPVRQAFYDVEPTRDDAPFTVLVTGGSQGSRALNKAARECWPLIATRVNDIVWLHQSGATECDALRAAFATSGLQGDVTAFIDDMPAAYARADVVVSRSGAGAVAELAAAGRPSILVPFPYAADDHQRHNAMAMAEAGAAIVIEESKLGGTTLCEALVALARDASKRRAMALNARAQAMPGAAVRAADVLLETAQKRPGA